MKKAQFIVDVNKGGVLMSDNYLIAKGLFSNKILPFNLNKLAFADKKELKGWFSLLLSYMESLNKVFAVNLVTSVSVTNFLRLNILDFCLLLF